MKKKTTNIEWADYTWNPIVGCSNGCSWCYAKLMNKRFKFIPDWTVPTFYPERLKDPQNMPMPNQRNRIARQISPNHPVIFVGSMADVFCEPYTRPWMEQIIQVTHEHPDKVFMFLTKNPYNFWTYNFPANCWLGTSISTNGFQDQMRVESMMDPSMIPNRKFLSIEPIMSTMAGLELGHLDFILVGAMTGFDPVIPEPSWVESIIHPVVFHKNNILEYIHPDRP